MNVDPYYQRQKCRSVSNSSFWQYKPFCRYSKAFLAGTSSNLREVVEIDEFAVFPLAYLRKFQK